MIVHVGTSRFFPSPRLRGEGGEDQRSEPGEGLDSINAPHPDLASLGPPSPRTRGEGKRAHAGRGKEVTHGA